MYNFLILDDEKQERDVIKYLLKQMPYQLNLFEAPNGKDGLLILDQQPIDILITDVKMPFMTGIELADYAKQYDQDIEIIFFSGHDDYDYLKKALLMNAITYILKPVQPSEFFDTITQTIEKLDRKRNTKLTEAQKERTMQKYIIRELINDVSLVELKQQYPSSDFNFLNSIAYYMIYQIDKLSSNRSHTVEQFILQFDTYMDYFQYNTKNSIVFFHESDRFFELKNKIESIPDLIGYYVIKKFDSPDKFQQSFREAEQELTEKAFYQNQRKSSFQKEDDATVV
ncbi:response regulator [Amphibacillus indicireducens]|uniref:Response regulatory domain-containing protein n=1 Tax=Amphibacillus indicireducens TaxID=1076330 RepID=A0ABP7VFT7_9BACI